MCKIIGTGIIGGMVKIINVYLIVNHDGVGRALSEFPPLLLLQNLIKYVDSRNVLRIVLKSPDLPGDAGQRKVSTNLYPHHRSHTFWVPPGQ